MLTKKQKMNMAKDIVLREIQDCYFNLSDAEADVEEMTARKVYQLAFAFCKRVTGLSWKQYCEEVDERLARRPA